MTKPATTEAIRSVKVTKDIIEAATQADSSHCMIADAIKAQYPHLTNVLVDLATIRFTDRKRGFRYVYLTPAAAQAALIRFDQGVAVEPFNVGMRFAQVTPIRTKKERPNVAGRATTAGKKTLDKARGEKGRRQSDAHPVIVGGRLPPTAVLSNARGRVREFGLRQLRP